MVSTRGNDLIQSRAMRTGKAVSPTCLMHGNGIHSSVSSIISLDIAWCEYVVKSDWWQIQEAMWLICVNSRCHAADFSFVISSCIISLRRLTSQENCHHFGKCSRFWLILDKKEFTVRTEVGFTRILSLTAPEI